MDDVSAAASHAELAILAQLERQTELLEQIAEHFALLSQMSRIEKGSTSEDTPDNVTDHSDPPGVPPSYIAFPVARQSDGKAEIRRHSTKIVVELSAPIREVRSHRRDGTDDKYRAGPVVAQFSIPLDHSLVWAEVEVSPGNWMRVSDPLDIDAELGL